MTNRLQRDSAMWKCFLRSSHSQSLVSQLFMSLASGTSASAVSVALLMDKLMDITSAVSVALLLHAARTVTWQGVLVPKWLRYVIK